MFFELFSSIAQHLLFFALHLENGTTFPKPLTGVQEKECFRRMSEGDSSARNELIEHNLRLVAHIVKKYYSITRDQDDLISIGTIGLIKAVNTFSYEKGTRFSTYASRCVENEILMHFRNLKKSASDVSINDPIDSDKDGGSLTLMDVIADETSLIDNIDLKLKSEKLYHLIRENLSDWEREIIILRYGLYGKRPLTQREIAARLHISRSYVSRIEKRALEILKKQFEKKERIR